MEQLLLYLILLLLSSGIVVSQRDPSIITNTVDQVDLPSKNDFIRRALHSIAVLGNYLYIEGGEVSANVNGSHLPGYDTRSFSITASLPLDKSWTDVSLSSDFKSIQKNGIIPTVKFFTLWVDEARNQIFSWGGDGPIGSDLKGPDLLGARNHTLWRLAPDGRGNGNWGSSSPNNPAVFDNIWRNAGGYSTVCGGRGYYMGGVANPSTDVRVKIGVSTPGLLTYDLTTNNWTNDTIPQSLGARRDGNGHCLPFGGDRGMLLFLGGISAAPADPHSFEWVDMTRMTIYDPESKVWFEQPTTSTEVPPKRRFFCSAGVKGQNGTYEIIIYGGRTSPLVSPTLSDTWVLTIPGFHWTKVNVTAPPRNYHRCAVAGGRQMISVGGLEDDDWKTKDPWTQGVGILDMSELTWRTSFEPNLPAYDSPDVIKTWYADGGLAKVQWQNDILKALFKAAGPVALTPAPGSSGDSGSSKIPVAAIVGGTIGGLALAAIIVFAYICVTRRRRRRTETLANHEASGHSALMSEMTIGHYPNHAEKKASELSPFPVPAELPSNRPEFRGPSELQGSQYMTSKAV